MDRPLHQSRAERYAAFRHRAYLRFWTARLLTTFATQVVSVAVGWQMYDLTRDPFDLGLVGIVQFLPSLILFLVTGIVADRFGRRIIMGLAGLLEAACAVALLLLTWSGAISAALIFAVLAVFGVARAFFSPASASLVANLVPEEDFANAVAWNSSAWQVATIAGPTAGGLLYGISPVIAFATAASMMAAGGLLALSIPKPAQQNQAEKPSLDMLFAGFRYIRAE
jgi:MFS family permease